MAVKIRLRVQGKKDRAFYRIIVADSRSPRDGKYLEMLGWYNPFDEENKAQLNGERLNYWLGVGAQLSPKAKSIAKQFQPEVLKKYLEKKLTKKPKTKKTKVEKPVAVASEKKEATKKPVKKAVKKVAKKAVKVKAAPKTEA
ncbi:MAG: hypothetical protein S4CHLAM7_06480 [Chlamydiae bacterium]|nr:hypothetical protein [Chlamydiota bacterium]